MTMTYTVAADRDRLRQRAVDRARPDLRLAAASLVAIVAIALACAGRFRVLSAAEIARGGAPPLNLNTVRDAGQLEPALIAAFTNPNDRRLAARELFRFLMTDGVERRRLPNVGALARATVSVRAIRETGGLEIFAARLAGGAAGQMSSALLPLFTPADVARLKPHLAVRTRDQFRNQVLLFGALYVLAFHAVALLWRSGHRRSDMVLLTAAHLLTAVGFAVLLSRPDPLRDSLLFVRYAGTTIAGVALMAALSRMDFTVAGFGSLSYVPLFAALSLSVLLMLFGTGPGTSAAKVNLGPVQPIEAIRLLLALFLAGYFARRWELLRDVRARSIRGVSVPGWLNLPRADYVVPVVIGVAAALLFFFFQKDLGPALFLCCVFLAIYALARGRVGMAIAGLLLLGAGFYLGYRLQVSATLAERVRMWQSPWDNAAAGGNQIAHSMWAMATGGISGTGLGLGDSRYLPAGHTDLILAAIGEELGAIGLIGVAILFAIVAWRGFRTARLAPNDYGFFLAASLTLFLVLPALIMASGVIGATPLTGVVTPFLSYGGSAMLANFAALGLLAAVHADERPGFDFAPFRMPLRCLGAALGVCAIAVVTATLAIQVVRADELVVKPHLGIQADGGRRLEYNPRVLDLVRELPRGTIFDRRGLPLATADPAVLAAAEKAYAQLGVSLDQACSVPGERCYPLGSRAFHVLGDARTRLNWAASNSSYVERDADARLQGFDDHASTLQTVTPSGQTMYTVVRDYRDLVPVLRHRHDPEHPAVVALRTRPRDVRLTLDANLQLRVSAIVADYARRAQGRAAAVVLDPATGAVLASVSYPWPAAGESAAAHGVESAQALLDRARYGAYPPGSTFKLVVALAALRQAQGLSGATYTCQRLSDGRVGSPIRGWTRPVRDDVLDTRPHGAIDMQGALVHSCNAYFAQLAVRLGPEPLLDTAGRLRISLARDARDGSASAARAVRDMLPQVGYGQAQVLASPSRMAMVAGVAAAGGTLRELHTEQGAADLAGTTPFLNAGAARLLGSYMRDAVVSGTGRSLRNHAWPIAGKTGTAEVSSAPSHSWFAGFAPYGEATRRIAFAIVVENAGYGAASAVPAAGEIVTAAAAAGLITK